MNSNKNEIIKKAEKLWNTYVEMYGATHDDSEYGSCVLGAGLEVQGGIFIRAPDRFQGSLTWENSVDEIIKFLKDNGLDAWYNPGRMD